MYISSLSDAKKGNYLQLILEELVHLRQFCGNAKIDGSVADLNDETAADIWVDLRSVSNAGSDNVNAIVSHLCDNLQLLSLCDGRRFGNALLKLSENSIVEWLEEMLANCPLIT